jgi:manganese/iron transport system ATP-binding protein/manganese/zinc/iron transport system ATP- binding protein
VPGVTTAAPQTTAGAAAVAAVRNLVAGYDGKPVLHGVSFDALRGERLAVLGPNGGGKTTLFRVLHGQLRPLAGTVHVMGAAATVPQTDRSRLDFPVDALDVVLMGTLAARPWWRPAGRHDRAAAREALATVGLAEHAHTSFGALSGGQRQRVLIARALVQHADLLLLDEPFAGLDSPSARRLEELLRELAAAGRAVLIATHDLVQARGWDRVLCLNREQIAVGTPDSVLSTQVLARTYGADLVRRPDGGQLAVLPSHHHEEGHDHT